MSTAQQIRTAIEPAVAPLGLIVEDITVAPAGKRRLVRVLVESDLAGLDATDVTSHVAPVSLDTVADATRAVDDALEATDVMGSGAYVLEVSSPGVGRPLTTRDHFRRNVGRLVELHHGDEQTTGRVVEVGADALTLEVPAAKKTPARLVTIALDDSVRGLVQVEFKHVDAADHTSPAADDSSEAEEEN